MELPQPGVHGLRGNASTGLCRVAGCEGACVDVAVELPEVLAMKPRMRFMAAAGAWHCSIEHVAVFATTARAAYKAWYRYERMLRRGAHVTPA